jgi:hypothetical protein
MMQATIHPNGLAVRGQHCVLCKAQSDLLCTPLTTLPVRFAISSESEMADGTQERFQPRNESLEEDHADYHTQTPGHRHASSA